MTPSSATAIWGMLGALALMATFMVVERILFLLEHSEADPITLRDWLRRCRRGVIECSRYQCRALGWLGHCLGAARYNRLELHRLSTSFREDCERFGPVLAAVPNLAQMLGLLGTAVGIGMCKVGVSDPYAMMGLAIETTKCGLLIAIPTLFALSLLNKRIRARHEQVERVLKCLDRLGGSRRGRPRRGRHAARPERRAPTAARPRADREATVDVKNFPVGNHGRTRHDGNGRLPVDVWPRAEDASPPRTVESEPVRDAAEKTPLPSAEGEGEEDAHSPPYDPVFDEIYNVDEAVTDKVGAASHKSNGRHARRRD